MKAFLPLWKRELQAFFLTSIGPVVAAFFLLITGTHFWLLASRLAQGPADSDLTAAFFGSPVFWLAMLVASPLLTMRLFAEEYRVGTIETLMTAPVTETEVVLAKYAGAYAAFLLLWLPTLSYPFALKLCGARLPPLDWGAMASGYLGTALIGASFLSLGLLCSLFARHQVVAAIASLALLGLLLSLGSAELPARLDSVRRLAPVLSVPLHMADFRSGIVDSRAVTVHLSATVLLLFSSIRILEARRLR